MDNNTLYHYGVPGMRWGHRKAADIVSTQKRKPRGVVVDGDGLTSKHKPRGVIKGGPKKRSDNLTPFQQERKRQKKHIATKRAVTYGQMYVNRYLEASGKTARVSSGTVALVNHLLDRKYMKDTFK